MGEITIVIKGINEVKKNLNLDERDLRNDLLELTNAGLSLSAASKYLAHKHNIPKNKIYNMY